MPANLKYTTRRNFIQMSAAAAVGLRIVSEPALARAAASGGAPMPAEGIYLNANENPLGPCEAARAAVARIIPQGGRYSDWLTDDLVTEFTKIEGLKKEYVRTYPGSSDPLHYAVLAFTSPERSYVTADPGYEAGTHAAEHSGARLVKVSLTPGYAHDVKAMLASGPDAGLFYICSPNNPTGTITGHADIEFLLANKPRNAVVMVDEAYIHFADATSTLDLVKADKDIVVLRTFSKIYGMAGLRCGFAIGRPDLLEKIDAFSGWSAMPITAVVAAMASLRDSALIAERKRGNGAIREETFEWLRGKGYSFTPSQSNCFMLDTRHPTKSVIQAMAKESVFIGRPWPVAPTSVRVTVGTRVEMERFRGAFERAISSV